MWRARTCARPGRAPPVSRNFCRRSSTGTVSISTATAAATSGIRYRTHSPPRVDCTQGVPEVTKPIREWLHAGFVPVRGQKLSVAEQAQPASLLQPEGIYGPAFLTTQNYFVIKEYNFSDLYVLFVVHLSNRMLSPMPFATT